MVALKGLSSELEGDIRLISLDRFPFKGSVSRVTTGKAYVAIRCLKARVLSIFRRSFSLSFIKGIRHNLCSLQRTSSFEECWFHAQSPTISFEVCKFGSKTGAV